VKYAAIVSGFSEIAVMKLDVLDELKEIKVCVAYKYKGKIYKDFPSDFQVLTEVEPVYKTLPGWESSIRGIKSDKKLPLNAKKYLKFIEDFLNVKIKYVSTGTRRDEIIVR